MTSFLFELKRKKKEKLYDLVDRAHAITGSRPIVVVGGHRRDLHILCCAHNSAPCKE